MLVLDPQATLPFQTPALQCQDVIAEARVETASKTQELNKTWWLMVFRWISSLYSWYSSQGSTWIIAVIAPKSHPNKKSKLSQFLVVSFWGICLGQHFMAWKAYVLWPRQRNAQFWDPFLERAFALLQLTMEVGVGAMGWSMMIFTDLHVFSSHTIGLVKVNQAIFLWRFQGWRCSFSDFVSYLLLY